MEAREEVVVRIRLSSEMQESGQPLFCGAALQQPFECDRIQEVEGAHDDISRQVLTIVAYPDAFHPCTTCSFDAGNGVLHDNTPVG